MNISRRRFLQKSISGATFLTGIALSDLLRAVAADTTKGGATAAGGTVPGGTNLKKGSAPSENVGDTQSSKTKTAEAGEPTAAKHPPIKGQVIPAGDAQYDEARKNYNGRFNIEPKSILYCQSENDVIQAVQWAHAQKRKVSIRAAGHSYEAFSLIQDGTVIDISEMTDFRIDAARKSATVAAGMTLLPFYEELWKRGVIVPGGSCASVGVAGSTLGGGFGLLARNMGLTCDNLQSLRMVDAQGKVIVADAKNHSDLLWACRGGGASNFGIVTQFTFKVHPIGNVSIIKMRWKWQDMKAVIQAWQKWAPNTDDRLTSVLTLSSKGADSLLFLGIFIGTPAAARTLVQPMLKAATPIKESIELSPFINAARRFSGFKRPTATPPKPDALPETVHMAAHPRFKNSSDYVNAELNEEAIDTIIKFLSDSPIRSSCVQFDGYGGAINRIPVKDSAFCHRADTKFCMHYQCSWGHASDDSKGIEWIDSFRQAMKPFVSGFSYANYCDRSMEDWGNRYYGENLARLNAIKSKYDPEEFFSYPQGLPGKFAKGK